MHILNVYCIDQMRQRMQANDGDGEVTVEEVLMAPIKAQPLIACESQLIYL